MLGALVVLAVLMTAAPATPARAQNLVSDLSNHLVAITSDFTGAEVLLFGSIAAEGDIVVTVAGPRVPVVVRRKQRVLGIWMNTDSIEFQNAPAFYAVASTRPITEIANADVQARQEMGVEHLAIRSVVDGDFSPEEITAFRQGLIRNKIKQGLYKPDVEPIQVLSDRLFRTMIDLPSNPLTGTYTVSVYLIQNGTVVEAQTNPLIVSKTGIGADIFLFAHTDSAAYGILAILAAIAAGWLAAAIFRKI
ncbi:MAG: TIGR02186 family protein [Alphaproteobacteria bacterium]|nr:TIGR02186 family protein [Alphaproteobacteria bacterium]